MEIREAIILAGGLGTRLKSAVPDLPKCMAPVNGKPFLYFVIRYLKEQGITHFIFSLGYKSGAFMEFIAAELKGSQYSIVIEEEPLGTGGAIRLALTEAQNDEVVIVNGDSLFSISLSQEAAHHYAKKALCTLALKRMEHFERYGVVELDSNSMVGLFKEKQFYETGLINGGVYILNKAAFLQKELPDKFSFETDYLQKFYTEGRFAGIALEGYFIDIGIPEDYAKAQKDLIG